MTLSELFLKGSFPYKGKHVELLETEKGVCFRHKKLVWRCFDFLSESNIIVTKTCETPDFISFVLIKEIISNALQETARHFYYLRELKSLLGIASKPSAKNVSVTRFLNASAVHKKIIICYGRLQKTRYICTESFLLVSKTEKGMGL